jgi:hypothetical protein
MWEIKETSPNSAFQHGHAVAGATPQPLTPNPTKFVRGILLRTPGAGDLVPNTDVVFVGRKCVTPDNNAGTGGMPLPPGSVLELPLEDASEVYVTSLSEGQDVAWLGV